MSDAVSPARLAENVESRFSKAGQPLVGYWMRVAGDREAYRWELVSRLRGLPFLVVVLRDDKFQNPNAFLNDFIAILDDNREACVRLDSRDRCGVVLLSRTELSVPQVSSPVSLPGWFPVRPGQTLSVRIEDLTWVADASLNASEAAVAPICELLLELEDSLDARVTTVLQRDRRLVNAFLDFVRRDDTEKIDDILLEARLYCAAVTTPSAFRPSLRQNCLVTRIWAGVHSRKTEDIVKPSKAVASALQLDGAIDMDWHESIVAVMRRPTGPLPQGPERFSRNLIVSIAMASQLVTSAAHSDDYGRYPIELLRSLSFDLRRSLGDADSIIRAAD